MSDEHTRIAEEAVELRERRGGGPASRDISGALGTAEMAIRTWRFGPGHAMAYHRHRNQEEVYHLVSGGPQQVQIGADEITVDDGDWVRVPKDTARRIVNTTDREAVWLTIGAPFGEGIMDGIRLDPETGEEIPRA